MHTFGDLRERVEKVFEITVNTNRDYSPPKVQAIKIEFEKYDTFDQIDFDNGIFFKKNDGTRIRGYLYLQDGYKKPYPNDQLDRLSTTPKYHINNCKVLQKMRVSGSFDQRYVFSNHENLFTDQEDEVCEIFLCSQCLSGQNEITNKLTSGQFIDHLMSDPNYATQFKPRELPKPVETDIWGYRHTFGALRDELKAIRGYKCEHCGIYLGATGTDRYYLEMDHKDGIKTNDKSSNLQCLCVLCHANKDEIHRRNYSVASNREKVEQFVRLYQSELISVGNPYLNTVRA
jgi:hypothetical protein